MFDLVYLPRNYRENAKNTPLATMQDALYLRRMTRIFDMDDRNRLPWRFYGATQTVLADL